ncbi:uncharacterized protein EAE98_000220 [Botrytis deweyae]|uniref:Uncharacterized protein n=1 Tax=Botrytis deweyae TaxID=2478750 RepID=A0ABQ7J232_9HELO|nr:uncharacterized protein EAE98_000220 [Botrytis deweyae]KAF7940093.1 hypothetical protein EAE98_000220 [Botrytis deweyae]
MSFAPGPWPIYSVEDKEGMEWNSWHSIEHRDCTCVLEVKFMKRVSTAKLIAAGTSERTYPKTSTTQPPSVPPLPNPTLNPSISTSISISSSSLPNSFQYTYIPIPRQAEQREGTRRNETRQDKKPEGQAVFNSHSSEILTLSPQPIPNPTSPVNQQTSTSANQQTSKLYSITTEPPRKHININTNTLPKQTYKPPLYLPK